MEYEPKFTNEQIDETIQGIKYNDKMLEYRFKLDKLKERIEIMSLCNIMLTSVFIVFEIYASWNPANKVFDIFLSVIVFIITVILSSAVVYKHIPEFYLARSGVFFITAFIRMTPIPIVFALMNVAFYIIAREIKEIKSFQDIRSLQ